MEQKTVLIGVTGCVAIYKACELVRLFQKEGLRVKVVMTAHSTEFVSPTLFRSLTREPVAVGLFDDQPGDPIHHISLAKEADVFLIAPATANVIAKISHGIADDLLTTTALATTSPLVIAPAMNVNMYDNPATQENLRIVKSRGIRVIDSEAGYLACGDVGKGRLADLSAIVEGTLDALQRTQDLAGKTVLITAGPTVEPIDPARYISNRSSGKTGFALAAEAVSRGAETVLITGPTWLDDPQGATVVRVQTAREMLEAASSHFDAADIAIFSAAVCDGRPAEYSQRKLKKGEDDERLSKIELTSNPDILATMGARKRDDQFVVGFAAETEQVVEGARSKLVRKNADMIVGNLVGEGKGFGTDDNQVVLVTAEGVEELERLSKRELAGVILDRCMGR